MPGAGPRAIQGGGTWWVVLFWIAIRIHHIEHSQIIKSSDSVMAGKCRVA